MLNGFNYRITSSINNDVGMKYEVKLIFSNKTGVNNRTHIFCNGYCNSDFSNVTFIIDNITRINPVYWYDNIVWVEISEGHHDIKIYYSKNQSEINKTKIQNEKIFYNYE